METIDCRNIRSSQNWMKAEQAKKRKQKSELEGGVIRPNNLRSLTHDTNVLVLLSWTGYEGYDSVKVDYVLSSITRNSGLTLDFFWWSGFTLVTLPSLLRCSSKLGNLNDNHVSTVLLAGYCMDTLAYNMWVENTYLLLTKENKRLKVEPGYISYTSVTVWLSLDTVATWKIPICCL